jgi:hypothetical protein
VNVALDTNIELLFWQLKYRLNICINHVSSATFTMKGFPIEPTFKFIFVSIGLVLEVGISEKKDYAIWNLFGKTKFLVERKWTDEVKRSQYLSWISSRELVQQMLLQDFEHSLKTGHSLWEEYCFILQLCRFLILSITTIAATMLNIDFRTTKGSHSTLYTRRNMCDYAIVPFQCPQYRFVMVYIYKNHYFSVYIANQLWKTLLTL